MVRRLDEFDFNKRYGHGRRRYDQSGRPDHRHWHRPKFGCGSHHDSDDNNRQQVGVGLYRPAVALHASFLSRLRTL